MTDPTAANDPTTTINPANWPGWVCHQPLSTSSVGSVCGLPGGHVGPHGEPVTPPPPDPGRPVVWPPTSERDAHLGAYVPFDIPVCTVKTPHEHHTTQMANGASLVCFGVPDGQPAAPAPAGLTAAQEIHVRLAAAAVGCLKPEAPHDVPAQAAWAANLANMVAALLEVTSEITLPDDRLDTAACPDPALHDQLRGYELRQVADLKTELLEAHADLEASQAREQIAAERVAELRPLVLELIGTDNENGLAGTTPRMLRAILAGDQGEEA